MSDTPTPRCSRGFGTGYIPSETCDMGCVDCQDICPVCKNQPALSAPPASAPRYTFRIAANGIELFYVPSSGWASHALGFHEGIGPYFSLPEALRRAEKIVGDSAWRPSVIDQAALDTRQPLLERVPLGEEQDSDLVLYAEVAALLTELAEMEKERAEALKILATRSGDDLLDACRQVKQVAISEADNSEKLDAALAEAEATIARLTDPHDPRWHRL